MCLQTSIEAAVARTDTEHCNGAAGGVLHGAASTTIMYVRDCNAHRNMSCIVHQRHRRKEDEKSPPRTQPLLHLAHVIFVRTTWSQLLQDQLPPLQLLPAFTDSPIHRFTDNACCVTSSANRIPLTIAGRLHLRHPNCDCVIVASSLHSSSSSSSHSDPNPTPPALRPLRLMLVR